MLELIALDKKISKKDYHEIYPALEIRLGECQRAAQAAGIPVVVVLEGWDAAGKGTLINRVTQALDPRGFEVSSTRAPLPTERLYPWMRRFWKALPAAGKIALFDRSWYGRVLLERMDGLASRREWQRAYDDIDQFERQLANDGVVIVKFWLHIGKREQRRRFKKLESHEATAWKVGKKAWRNHRQYDEWLESVEEMLERTDTAHARWTVVEATQGRFARVKVMETLIKAIEREIERRDAQPDIEPRPMPVPEESALTHPTILDRVDLSLSLSRADYQRQLDDLQDRLRHIEHELFVARVPAVVVYQGWDAAGKGGNIRRVTQGLDPRGYQVVPIAAPTAEEKAHHYLWRFWKRVPKAGHIHIFDRSWYGRVLVERVEGFCSEAAWQRAFREINEFERQLVDYGAVMVKFWLHIDPDEQLRRFKSREQTPHKQWKIGPEDWRNREKWKQYEVAVVEMLQRTSTTAAPWTILEANCKLHARVKALGTVVESLENALRRGRKKA